MHVAKDGIRHCQFNDFYQWLQAGDVVVFNNTKVIAARLFGKKSTGGAIEILIERIIDNQHILAHLKSSKAPKAGSQLLIDDAVIDVVDKNNTLYQLRYPDGNWLNLIENCGHIPLPPYLHREDETLDNERYQTVYAKHSGAVAAPTAGLHFENNYQQHLQEKGVNIAEVTLHVGAGTFQPVKVEDISQHKMHSESYIIDSETCEMINQSRQKGGRVIAVGTTSVRVLESASVNGKLHPTNGETDIFIKPGYHFKMVDALLTNFHLPESTLLMLVCAFSGYERIMSAYQVAIDTKYRFYSYGDAMLLTPKFA